MTRWTHGLINRLVLCCDVSMTLVAAIASYVIWDFATWSQVAILGAIGVLIFTQILQIGRAYRVEHYVRPLRQVGHLLIAGAPAALVIGIAYYALVPMYTTNLGGLVGWAVLTFIALIFGRLVLVRFGMTLVERHAVLRRNVVLIGDPARARAFMDRCDREKGERELITFLGIFDDEGREPRGSRGPGANSDVHAPVLGNLADLLEFVKHHQVDVVAIVEPWHNAFKISAIANQMYRIAADVVVELDPEGFTLNFARLINIAGQPALQVQQRPLKGSLGLLKWVEDYVVALIGLILVSPILLAAAAAIKLDSPGPVMFRQPRVGLNNKVFTVYKLRTMRTDPYDDGSAGTVRTDPRITRVGAILRRLSIDELPQLINVLQGDMSVVGPRPHVPNMQVTTNVRYEAVRQYVARYRVKPGITGWAQINGMRGGIHTVEKAERGVELDLFYIENWSIWFDIRIMLLTITKGMAGPSVF